MGRTPILTGACSSGRKVLDTAGRGAARTGGSSCEIATRMGLPMEYGSSAEVFDEFAGLTKNYATLSHAKLGCDRETVAVSGPSD